MVSEQAGEGDEAGEGDGVGDDDTGEDDPDLDGPVEMGVAEGDGLDVALHPRPAAGIGAGDDQDATKVRVVRMPVLRMPVIRIVGHDLA